MHREDSLGRRSGRLFQPFVIILTLSLWAAMGAWANGGDPPDNGTRILWVNAGDGQTDSTWSAMDGTGSIHNEMKGGFSDWAGFLEDLGFENTQVIESQIVLSAELLGPYGYVVFAFTTRDYDAGETEALEQWVRDGGRVLVIGSFALGHSDNPHNNTVLAPFGIAFGDREQTRLLELTGFSPHPVTDNVALVQSDVADYLDVAPGVEILARYKGRPALALAQHGDGEVLTFWDCNCFFNGVYAAWDLPCIHDADNQTFATNIFKYFRWGWGDYVPPPTRTPTATPFPTATPTPTLPAIGLTARIEPSEPKTLDDLECITEVVDYGGYPGFDYTYRWFRNGAELTEPLDTGGDIFLATGPVLSHHFTAKNETYFCLARAEAWETYGEVWAEAQTSPVTIHNSTPTAPVVEIRPPEPVPGEDLGINILTYSSDPDGDDVDYRIDWYESEDGGETWVHKVELTDLAFISGLYLQEGDLWRVVVTPNEVVTAKAGSAVSIEEGEPGWDQVYVGYNSDPLVTVTFAEEGNVMAMPEARIFWAAVDPDGDRVTVNLFYDADGVEGGSVLITSGLDASGSIDWEAPGTGKGMLKLDLSGNGLIGSEDLFLLASRWETDPAGSRYRIFARAYDLKGALGKAFSDGWVISPESLPCDRDTVFRLRTRWHQPSP